MKKYIGIKDDGNVLEMTASFDGREQIDEAWLNCRAVYLINNDGHPDCIGKFVRWEEDMSFRPMAYQNTYEEWTTI